jgi:hypothetical protein
MAKPLTIRLNELEYEFDIYLDNGAGSSDTSKFIINPTTIVNLTIEETLADWVTRGTLTIYYSFDAIENSSQDITKTETGAPVPNYIFRNDGNDTLYIRLYPNLKFLQQQELNLKVDPVHWELIYNFSIYDIEDIDMPPGAESAASAAIKCKKFYFWDSWYQKMITNTMEYSTAETAQIFSQAPLDSERSIPTGDAMKAVILKALGDTSNNIPYIDRLVGGDKQLWESGASKIFYTAPAYNNAYDTLTDIYKRHVSNNYAIATKARAGIFGPRGSGATGNTVNDFSILTKERGPKEGDLGYFALQPMSKYFEKAGKNEPGEYQIERFIVQSIAGEDANKPGAKRAPVLAKQDLQRDTKLGQYSQITSYRFVDISPFMNSTEFVNRPVYSFDFRERKYNVEFNNNSVVAARDFAVRKYTNNLPVFQTNSKQLFLITLDEDKKTKNMKPQYSLYGGNESTDFINRQSDGFQKLLKIGVFQNSCLFFRTQGSTNRVIGRFIVIEKETSVQENSFEDRFYGQWFIINVKHVIENGIYYNEIAAVKLHRFQPLKKAHVATI